MKDLTKYPPGDYQPLLFGYKICKEWLVGIVFCLCKKLNRLVGVVLFACKEKNKVKIYSVVRLVCIGG